MLRQFVEYGMIEIHLEIHFKAIKRDQLSPFVTIFDADLFLNANEAFRRILFLDASGLQQEHKRSCAAIHNGYFGSR